MAGQAQLVIGKRTKISEHTEAVQSTLWEDGPQTMQQLADRLDVSYYWMSDILGYMKAEGAVSNFRRDNSVYWILYDDLIAA